MQKTGTLESLEVLQHAASRAALSFRSSSTQHFRLCSHGKSSRLRAHIRVSSPLSLTCTPELICSVQLEPQTHQLNWHSTFCSLVFQNAQGLMLLHPVRESLQQKIPGSMKAVAIITGSYIWFIVEQNSPSVLMKYSQACLNRCIEIPRWSIYSLVEPLKTAAWIFHLVLDRNANLDLLNGNSEIWRPPQHKRSSLVRSIKCRWSYFNIQTDPVSRPVVPRSGQFEAFDMEIMIENHNMIRWWAPQRQTFFQFWWLICVLFRAAAVGMLLVHLHAAGSVCFMCFALKKSTFVLLFLCCCICFLLSPEHRFSQGSWFARITSNM